MLTLYFDGLFRGVPGGTKKTVNAGFMSYGWLVVREGLVIARGHGVSARGKDATSNVAEYLALIEGLEALADMGCREEPIRIHGDARCIIDQMRGVSNVNSERMRPLFRRAIRLADLFGEVEWVWIPRRNNRAADMLTRHAMRQARLDVNGFQSVVDAINPNNGKQEANGRFLNLVDLRVFLPRQEPGFAQI